MINDKWSVTSDEFSPQRIEHFSDFHNALQNTFCLPISALAQLDREDKLLSLSNSAVELSA